MFRYGNFADDGSQFLQAGDGSAHLRRHLCIHVWQLKPFGQNADFQITHALAQRGGVSLHEGAYWRGSSPSSPAMASSINALSRTLAVIGPAWSIVASIGMMPV